MEWCENWPANDFEIALGRLVGRFSHGARVLVYILYSNVENIPIGSFSQAPFRVIRSGLLFAAARAAPTQRRYNDLLYYYVVYRTYV